MHAALERRFVLSVTLCSEFFMCRNVGIVVADGDIDRGHHGAIWYERKLEPLVTRTPKEQWMIHPGWVQRYVLY